MSIYNYKTFFVDGAVEIINFKVDGIGAGVDVAAIITRHAPESVSPRLSDQQPKAYAFEILLPLEIVPEVTEKRSRIVLKDRKGRSRSVLVHEILEKDPETDGCWKLGAI